MDQLCYSLSIHGAQFGQSLLNQLNFDPFMAGLIKIQCAMKSTYLHNLERGYEMRLLSTGSIQVIVSCSRIVSKTSALTNWS